MKAREHERILRQQTTDRDRYIKHLEGLIERQRTEIQALNVECERIANLTIDWGEPCPYCASTDHKSWECGEWSSDPVEEIPPSTQVQPEC